MIKQTSAIKQGEKKRAVDDKLEKKENKTDKKKN